MGFRDEYLDYEALTAQLREWAAANPDTMRLESIGVSADGRNVWLATVGTDLDRARPAVWIDGNMHACELAGSSVALAIIDDLLRLHRGESLIDGPVRERVLDVPFYIVPRMSPDGAEAVLRSGRYVRSVPRDERPNRGHARWIRGDIDGDGLSLLMRVEDEGGEFVESTDEPGLMVPRRIEDSGPYYKVYPEGTIANFDGDSIPTPSFLSDNQTDLNRNFPYTWAAEHMQVGAGTFPGSEPESRAVIEAAIARPNIFAWVNYHCFGGVFIRPLGEKPDNKMNAADLALYRQLGEWAEALCSYPMVSGFEEFTYEPDKPLHGDLSDWAYHQRGCVSYVVELWDFFRAIEMAPTKRFVDHYSNMTRDDLLRFARWDREHNHGRSLRPWRRFEHPQLGPVDIGGIDFRVGVWNPPYEKLDEICRSQSAMVMRVAALAPCVHLGAESVRVGDVREISITVSNRGYLPTHVLGAALELAHNEPLYLEIEVEGGELVAGQARTCLGHLDGWGRGLGAGTGMPAYAPDRGSTHRKRVRVAVRGQGHVRIRAGSCRVGWLEQTLD